MADEFPNVEVFRTSGVGPKGLGLTRGVIMINQYQGFYWDSRKPTVYAPEIPRGVIFRIPIFSSQTREMYANFEGIANGLAEEQRKPVSHD